MTKLEELQQENLALMDIIRTLQSQNKCLRIQNRYLVGMLSSKQSSCKVKPRKTTKKF